jgi:hypothetical protein
MTHGRDAEGKAVSASDVIKQAFAAYRAWGIYLVSLTAAFFVVAGLACIALIVALGEAGYAIAIVISVFATPWVQAMIVDAVAAIEEPTADRSLLGRLGAVVPYSGTLLVVWILYTAGLTLGFLLFVVPGFVFYTWWAVVIPVLVLERRGVWDSFSRSRRLVTGRGRTVFGTLFMSAVLCLVPALPIYLAAHHLPLSQDAADLVSQFVATSLCLPFLMLCQTVLYADLRSRFASPSWA